MSTPERSAKPVIRRCVRRSRAARAPEDRAAVADALAAHVVAALVAAGRSSGRAVPGQAPGGAVAAFRSLPGEPGTAALRDGLRRAGCGVLLPVLLDDRDLDWVPDPGPPDDGDPLRPRGGRLGPQALATCDLVLVPALAVDAAGTRLGQGGGSYDRALARLGEGTGRPLVLAVVHDDEVLDDLLPREPHDVPVDGALTPSGLVLLGSGRRGWPAAQHAPVLDHPDPRHRRARPAGPR